MSEYGEYGYNLEAQRRRELYLEQIKGNATQRIGQYLEEVENMDMAGISQHVQKELATLQIRVDQMQTTLVKDPEEAYRLGRGLLRDLALVRYMGELAREEFLKKQAQKLLQECQQDLGKMDIVTQDFASTELEVVVQRLMDIQSNPSPENIQKIPILKKQINEIISVAEEKASLWTKERKEAAVRVQEIKYQFEEATQVKGSYAQIEKSELQVQLQIAQEALQNNDFEKVVEISKASEKQLEKIHEEAFEENVRREVLKGIVKTLKKLGFHVGKPKIINLEEKKDQVVLLGKKASGQSASFEVEKNGKMSFKFDHYEGMACHQDIQKVQDKLKEIYGVHISQERVLWQNPDKISKGSKPLPQDIHKNDGTK